MSSIPWLSVVALLVLSWNLRPAGEIGHAVTVIVDGGPVRLVLSI